MSYFQSSIRSFSRSLRDCDGAISITSEAYEPETTRAVHDWFSEEGKQFFAPGPLTVPIAGLSRPVSRTSPGSSDLSPQDVKVQALLERSFEKYGKQSLIYVRSRLSDHIQSSRSHNNASDRVRQCLLAERV